MVTYFDGAREIAVSLPVPKHYKTAMQERAKIIHDVFTSFFKVNFLQHDSVNAFASLDLDLNLDWNSRKRGRDSGLSLPPPQAPIGIASSLLRHLRPIGMARGHPRL